jgi:MYXO-CTERM domain-containing protein
MRGRTGRHFISARALALFVVAIGIASIPRAAVAAAPLTFVTHTTAQGAGGAWVSADGSIVAGYTGGGPTDIRPAYWIGGRPPGAWEAIPMPTDPNAVMARTTAMSGNGKVMVGYYGPSDYPDYARAWVHTVGTNFTTQITNPANPTIGANDTMPTAVNHDGSVIVGRYHSSPTSPASGGFRRTADGVVHPLNVAYPNAISPDGNIVVGGVGNDGVIWRASGPSTNLPFAATTLTPDGSIVGGTNTLSIPMPGGGTLISNKAVLWQEGTITELGDLPGGVYRSIVNDLSADGSIAVGTSDGGNSFNAFIWDAAHGMRSLQSMVADAGYDLTGLRLTSATSISDDGVTITGTGLDLANGARGFVWVMNPVAGEVPDPSGGPIAMLAVGATWAGRRRRRNE